jgi:hypothetical protein
MCFYVSNENPDAIVATRNIRVYKRLEDLKITKRGNLIGKSPYRNYIWYKGKAISFKEPFRLDSIGYTSSWKNKIEAGLHAYSTIYKAELNLDSGEIICEFFIPKDSIYYINKAKGEIISNCMIWSGRIWKKDRWGELKIKNK